MLLFEMVEYVCCVAKRYGYYLVANLAYFVPLFLVGFFEPEVFPYTRTFSTLFCQVDHSSRHLPIPNLTRAVF